MLYRLFIILSFVLGSPAMVECFPSAPVENRNNSLKENAPEVKVYSGGIEIIVKPESGTYNFRVYSITGQVVKRLKLSEGSERIELPQGCYIVKCEAWTKSWFADLFSISIPKILFLQISPLYLERL